MSDYVYATGKKKCSCAKVFLQYNPSNSFISINNKSIDDFSFLHREFVLKPLVLINGLNNFFIKIIVRGGGVSSQLVAVRHGLSRALTKFADMYQTQEVEFNIKENLLNYRKLLKSAFFLTRDARIVERKKFGHKKARKREQYSKR